jgi:hypothetical protein
VRNRVLLRWVGFAAAGAAIVAAAAVFLLRESPGSAAHAANAETGKPGLYYDLYTPPRADRDPDAIRVTGRTRVPDGFEGTFTLDPQSGRMWLVDHGPPANIRGPSRLWEVNPRNGRVLAEAVLPFLGELATPVFVNGALYQAVPHESKLYRLSVDHATFGRIEGEVPLPALADLATPQEAAVYRFPFINFSGASATAEGNLLMYAEELGELVTIDPATGAVVGRVATLRSLRAVALVHAGSRPLLLASADPAEAEMKAQMRLFMFRSAEGITPPSSLSMRDRPTYWLLVDPITGEVLSSAVAGSTPVSSRAATVVRHEADGSRYGRFTFLAAGEEGVLTMQWNAS